MNKTFPLMTIAFFLTMMCRQPRHQGGALSSSGSFLCHFHCWNTNMQVL